MATITDKGFRGYLLSAAIDIGTSSTCFAYVFKSSPNNIHLSTILGGQEGLQNYKTPTAVLTEAGSDGEFIAFGSEAEKKYREMIADGKTTSCNLYNDFKMILYREKTISKADTMVTSKIGTQRPLMDIYVMTLESIASMFVKQLEQEGHSVIRPREVRWVLCVPATWTDRAKDFIRHAAFKAGLIEQVGSPQLVILLEATAAALYCTRKEARFSAGHLKSEEAMQKGTKYIVVDAGAGTVDYTAQETVEEKRVKEIAFSSGGDWGGRHVDKRFIQLLKDVLGEYFIADFIQAYPQQWYEFECAFEKAKATVEDYDSTITLHLHPMLERFMLKSRKELITDVINAESKSHGLSEKDGSLIISKEKVRSFFDPSIFQITGETARLVDLNELKDLNFIFLVGGFSSCKLVQSAMKDQFSDHRLVIPQDARAAVVLGAAKYGLNPGIVTRMATKTYGVSTYSDFKEHSHSVKHKKSFKGKDYCSSLFLPFVRKGEVIEPGTHGQMIANPVTAEITRLVIDFYCIDRELKPGETLYVNSEGVQKVGVVAVDMPDTRGGVDREVLLQFTFTDEILVVATDKTTGESKESTLKFDYDIRK